MDNHEQMPSTGSLAEILRDNARNRGKIAGLLLAQVRQEGRTGARDVLKIYTVVSSEEKQLAAVDEQGELHRLTRAKSGGYTVSDLGDTGLLPEIRELDPLRLHGLLKLPIGVDPKSPSAVQALEGMTDPLFNIKGGDPIRLAGIVMKGLVRAGRA